MAECYLDHGDQLLSLLVRCFDLLHALDLDDVLLLESLLADLGCLLERESGE